MGFLSLSPVNRLDPPRAKTIFRLWRRSGPGNATEQGAADEGAGGEDAGRPPERGVVAVGFKSHLHRH